MVNWGLLVIVLLGSVATTGILKRLALHKQLLGVPVARSAHSIPVPTSGGLAIALTFYLSLFYLLLQESIPTSVVIAMLAGCLLAALGYADDLQHLSIRHRLPLQFIAATWTIWWLGDAPVIAVGQLVIDFPVVVHVFSVVALVWLLNLFNFMDGIDGLAASQATYVSLLVFLLLINSSEQVVTLLSALLCAATIGFLVWNWPPAKIFMGDSGSSFLGYALGFLALLSLQNDSLNVWVWLLLLGVFVVDATYTLIRRILNGQRWTIGHNTHAYQQAARQLRSHKKVTISILLINILWLTPLAWAALARPQWGVYLTVLGLAPLIALAIHFKAGELVNDGKIKDGTA